MSWLIWQIAAGRAFFVAVSVLAVSVAMRPLNDRRIYRFSITIMSLIAAELIAISATALPPLIYIFWASAILWWLLVSERRSSRSSAVARGALLLSTLVAVFVEMSRELRPSIGPGSFPRLYVIGDSISAGIGTVLPSPVGWVYSPTVYL